MGNSFNNVMDEISDHNSDEKVFNAKITKFLLNKTIRENLYASTYCEDGERMFTHNDSSLPFIVNYRDLSVSVPKLDMENKDKVNSPDHYIAGGLEVIDIIEAFELDYNIGNAVKYILRHNSKGKPIEDLRKCKWYIDREISKLEDE